MCFGLNSFEGIPSEADFVVTTGEDGVTSSLQVLNTGQQPVQVYTVFNNAA